MNDSTPYESLLNIGRSLRAFPRNETADEPSAAEIGSFLAANRDLLEQVRVTLSPACRVPVVYDKSHFEQHSDSFLMLRDLATALRWKIEELAAKGEFVPAARWAIDLLDLANGVRRGGLIVDSQVSIAVGGHSAVEQLRRIRHQLPADYRPSLIEELTRVDAQHEPFAEILARDREWERRVDLPPYNPRDAWTPEMLEQLEQIDRETHAKVKEYLASEDPPNTEPDNYDFIRLQNMESLAKLRLLAIDTALRLWQSTRGRYPESLDELTPEILPTLPLDPYAAAPFRYRRHGDQFLLYSVGYSGVDQGGAFGPCYGWERHNFDLCLDSYDYYDWEWPT